MTVVLPVLFSPTSKVRGRISMGPGSAKQRMFLILSQCMTRPSGGEGKV